MQENAVAVDLNFGISKFVEDSNSGGWSEAERTTGAPAEILWAAL